MTDATAEYRVRTGARLAVAVAVVGSLVVGVAVGGGLATLLGALAAGLFALGARLLVRDDNRQRARGSVALSASAVAGGGAVGLASSGNAATVLVATTTVGTALVACDAVVEDVTEGVRPVVRAVTASAPAVLVGAVLSYAIYTGALFAGVVAAATASTGVVGYSTFASLVLLQTLAIAAVVLLHVALPVVDRWTTDRGDRDALSPLREFGIAPTDVPYQVWVGFSVQVLALVVGPEAYWFETVLDALSVLGDAISVLLHTGILHVPLAAVCLLATAVVLARGIQIGFVAWAGRNPPRTLAYATGGVVAGVVGVVASAVTAVTWFGLGPAPGSPLAASGPGALGLGFLLAATIACALVVLPLPVVASAGVVRSAQGYAVGAALLFVAALATAGVGATPVAAFVGVAAALLVWDLGENATVLRTQLGRRVATREAELTHATASVVVAVLAVGVATVAVYLVGPRSLTGVDPTRARVAAALATVAVVAFALLLER